jgi:hypothetical protein
MFHYGVETQSNQSEARFVEIGSGLCVESSVSSGRFHDLRQDRFPEISCEIKSKVL